MVRLKRISASLGGVRSNSELPKGDGASWWRRYGGTTRRRRWSRGKSSGRERDGKGTEKRGKKKIEFFG